MEALRQLLSSKKAVMLVVTVIVLGAFELFGKRLSAELVTAVVVLVAAYLGAQGIADHGAGAQTNLTRGGAAAAHRVHTPEAAGSNPARATNPNEGEA